jgi:Protein of unknown function (DUF2889)
MSLPEPKLSRALRHVRNIEAQAFEREDGLWDIDTRITDTKTRVSHLASGDRHPGEPIHDLWLRVTINTSLTIVDVEAVSQAVPYPGYCNTIGSAYKKLIGLNLMRGFRNELRERLAGIEGCTHITELAGILPTAAIQAFAGDVLPTGDTGSGTDMTQVPFQLDRCHALRRDGPAVEKYYPRWYIKPALGS